QSSSLPDPAAVAASAPAPAAAAAAAAAVRQQSVIEPQLSASASEGRAIVAASTTVPLNPSAAPFISHDLLRAETLTPPRRVPPRTPAARLRPCPVPLATSSDPHGLRPFCYPTGCPWRRAAAAHASFPRTAGP